MRPLLSSFLKGDAPAASVSQIVPQKTLPRYNASNLCLEASSCVLSIAQHSDSPLLPHTVPPHHLLSQIIFFNPKQTPSPYTPDTPVRREFCPIHASLCCCWHFMSLSERPLTPLMATYQSPSHPLRIIKGGFPCVIRSHCLCALRSA